MLLVVSVTGDPCGNFMCKIGGALLYAPLSIGLNRVWVFALYCSVMQSLKTVQHSHRLNPNTRRHLKGCASTNCFMYEFETAYSLQRKPCLCNNPLSRGRGFSSVLTAPDLWPPMWGGWISPASHQRNIRRDARLWKPNNHIWWNWSAINPNTVFPLTSEIWVRELKQK